MATIKPTFKAGPPGMPRLSQTLMRRPGLGDPRLRRAMNILATNRRTARGLSPILIDYQGVPQATEDAIRVLENAHNALLANLKARGLMELTE